MILKLDHYSSSDQKPRRWLGPGLGSVVWTTGLMKGEGTTRR